MILITGANGWLGYNLIKLISENQTEKWGLKNDKIIAFIEYGTDIKKLNNFKNITIIEGDLKKDNDLNRFLSYSNNSLLIHTTGIIHPFFTKEFYDVNYLITKKLTDKLKNYSIKKTIILSSNSVNGFNININSPFNELSIKKPYLHYGKSKNLMEKQVFKAMKDHNITIIRAPWFYGKNQPLRQKTFLKMIKDNKFPIIGDGKNLRSMVYMDNLVQGISLASSKKTSRGKVYWIADREPYSMLLIINTIKNIFNEYDNISISKKNIYLPNFISKFARILDFIIQFFGLYNSKIHVLGELNMNIFCSIDKAVQDLGYHPKYNLYEGMKESIKEFCE